MAASNPHTFLMRKYRKNFTFSKKRILIVCVFLLLIIWNAAIVAFFLYSRTGTATPMEKKAEAREITQIKATTDIRERERSYTELIERIGPEEAQEALQNSGLPYDGEAHLLNHKVGDWLYKKYGADGLIKCKDYFLSSCYHGFIILAVAKEGTGVLDEMMTKCWTKGFNTAVQCAHSIGHGMLAYEGYKELPIALAHCDRMEESSANFPTYNCYDGVFMENMRAVHNDGKPSPDRWLKKDDIIFPCNSPEIDEKYRKACWSNQPAWIYEQMLGDNRKVADECLKLTNAEYQTTCFDSLARIIHPLSMGSIDRVMSLCSAMPTDYWDRRCQISVLRSSLSMGEKNLPFTICSRFPRGNENECYVALIEILTGVITDNGEKEKLCNKITNTAWRDNCQRTPLYQQNSTLN